MPTDGCHRFTDVFPLCTDEHFGRTEVFHNRMNARLRHTEIFHKRTDGCHRHTDGHHRRTEIDFMLAEIGFRQLCFQCRAGFLGEILF